MAQPEAVVEWVFLRYIGYPMRSNRSSHEKPATFTPVRKSNFWHASADARRHTTGVKARIRMRDGKVYAGQTTQNHAREEQAVLNSVKKSPELANMFLNLTGTKTALIDRHYRSEEGEVGFQSRSCCQFGCFHHP